MTGAGRLSGEDQAAFEAAVAGIEPVDGAALRAALDVARIRELDRREYLLRAGQPASEVAVVVRGLLREYFVAPGGVERTKAFVLRGEWTGSLADLIGGGPARAFIVAEEPSRLLVSRYRDMRALARRFPAWEHFRRRAAEQLLLVKAEREYELLGLDAEARYVRFAERYPGLEARVAGRHVASYLGITPVHLSRLRRRRTKKDARSRGLT